MGSRRQFLTAAAGFAAGTVAVGTAEAAPRGLVTLLHGRGAPGRHLGIVGDFYIDDRDHSIYGPKRASGWGARTSLVGRAGKAGKSGSRGPDGPQGYSILHGDGPPTGGLGEDNDFYIDTGTTQLYGPREGGVWGSPISLSGSANISVIDGGSL